MREAGPGRRLQRLAEQPLDCCLGEEAHSSACLCFAHEEDIAWSESQKLEAEAVHRHYPEMWLVEPLVAWRHE